MNRLIKEIISELEGRSLIDEDAYYEFEEEIEESLNDIINNWLLESPSDEELLGESTRFHTSGVVKLKLVGDDEDIEITKI